MVEEDTRVEDIEGRIIDCARQYDILQELESVGVVDLFLYALVSNRDGLMEAGCLAEKVAVVRLVSGKFRVVWMKLLLAFITGGTARERTFKHTNDTKEQLVVQNMFVHAMIIEHYWKELPLAGRQMSMTVVSTHVLCSCSYSKRVDPG